MKTSLPKKLVIANRGEIARRILHAGKERGFHTAVIATADDLNSLVAREADHVIKVSSFLNAKEIVQKCQEWQADLIHPGYGFLSENFEFAKLIEDADITFVGPTSENMKAMGAKEQAKEIAQKCNVPTLGALFSTDLKLIPPQKWELELSKRNISSPYLVKANGGGGGRGMRIVEKFEDLENAIERASQEAQTSFGDSRVFVERALLSPRHIEIQVFGDGKGGGIFWGERECSLQRRHQKVIEEAPSSFVKKELRKQMGLASLALVKETKYRGAGTVEFLVDDNENFYFLEMNTRLQVEHPVTELAYGIDLVQAQFDLALGNWPADFPNPNEFHLPEPSGVSLEARILAEDTKNQFLPTPGKIIFYKEPQGEGIRVDSGVTSGSVINSNFDSMIAKLIVHAPNRTLAAQKLKRALSEFIILGCTTNISFLHSIAGHPDFLQGHESTSWIAENLSELNKPQLSESLLPFFNSRAFAEKLAFVMLGRGILHGVNKIFSRQNLSSRGEAVSSRGLTAGSSSSSHFEIKKSAYENEYVVEDIPFYAIKTSPKEICLSVHGECITLANPLCEIYHAHTEHLGKTEIHAPMAGKVFDILVHPNDKVETNQLLFIVESMKMQLEIRAKNACTIQKILVEKGQILSGPDLMAIVE